MALGHDRFANRNAFLNHQVIVDTRTGDNRPGLDGAVLLHHVNERAVLAGLHGLIGHGQRIRLGGEP